MYIDDGVIFACGRTWTEIETTMCDGYKVCIEWLEKSGLSAELSKTELLFFKKR